MKDVLFNYTRYLLGRLSKKRTFPIRHSFPKQEKGVIMLEVYLIILNFATFTIFMTLSDCKIFSVRLHTSDLKFEILNPQAQILKDVSVHDITTSPGFEFFQG